LALSLYDPERHRQLTTFGGDARINPLSYAAATLWVLGYPDQALKRSNEAIELAHALSHPHDLAFAEAFSSLFQQLRRDARATQAAAERLIALSVEHGFTFWSSQATIIRGCAITEQGRNEAGIAQMQEGLAALRAAGPRPQYLRFLAKACIETGRLDEGQSALTEALAAADEHEVRDIEAELHRLKGELLLKQNHTADAESCFRRAIEIARTQGAKSWELRATMSLARLLDKQGRRDEARTMLAEIYHWFTEGFDTADLKDAKTLLDGLNA
jgi:adenylate cyclase